MHETDTGEWLSNFWSIDKILSQRLEREGHQVAMIRESRIGYVVYEDDFQVVAEPFTETGTAK
jgi:hypothetical protein